MPVVAYNEDAVVEEVASAGPEACTLGGLKQRGPERVSERRQDPCRRSALGCADWAQVTGSEASQELRRRRGARGSSGFRREYVSDGLHRAVSKAVYVLHAFQKKSRRAIGTPKGELDLVGTRLSRAKEDYEAWLKSR